MQLEIGDGKTVEQVEAYAKVFWQRYRELEDGEKMVKKVDDAAHRRDQIARQNALIKAKVKDCPSPYQQLAIPYTGQTKGKQYTEEEDRFLLVKMARDYPYGLDSSYESIKMDICAWPAFRFDWCVGANSDRADRRRFIKSRTPAEIGRRCTTLVGLIVKEVR